MKTPPFRHNTLTALAVCTLAATAPAHAAIQVLDYYHMGEADSPAGLLVDSVGQEAMKAGDSTVVTGDVSPAAAKRGSTKYRHFTGATEAYSGRPRIVDPANCGIEAWVRPSPAAGSGCIVYNGTPGKDGFGIFLSNGRIQARVGPTTLSSDFSSSGWHHVALVLRSQRSAELYVDGQLAATSYDAMSKPPTGDFTIGGSSDSGKRQYFTGDVDEVRVFKGQSNGFTPGDLLVSFPEIYLKAVDNLTFPALRTGELSTPVALVIESTGQAPLRLLSMTVEGENAADFLLQPGFTPGMEIGVHRDYLQEIVFAPSGVGQRSAVLKVTSNDPFHPLVTLPLDGWGLLLPRIALSNSSGAELGSDGEVQDFSHRDEHGGSLPLSFTIRNTGNTDLSGLAITLAGTNAEEFHATLTGANTLGPDGKAGVMVSFASTAGGVRRAVLVIGGDNPQVPKFKIPLTATGTGQEIEITADPDGQELVSGKLVVENLPADFAELASHPEVAGFLNAPAGLSGVTAVSARISAGTSSSHGLALKSDRTVVAWGDDQSDESLVPGGLHDVTAVAAGGDHSLALKSDGTVVAWGFDDEGQTDVPAGLSGVVAIAAGNVFSIALKSDGTVVSWGYAPEPPAGLSGVIAIAAGDFHVLALKSDGTVVAWGIPDQWPDAPPGLGFVTAIAANESDSCALTSDGKLVVWGGPSSNLLPNPRITDVSDVKTIAGGWDGNGPLVLKNDGTVSYSVDSSEFNPDLATLKAVKAVSGRGITPVAVTDPVVDFGGQVVNGTGKMKTFTIRNSGQAPLTISGVQVSGGQGFSLSGPLPAPVPAGGTGKFAVLFNPAADGNQQGDLVVLSDDSDEPVFSARLVATATDTPLKAWRRDHFGTLAGEGDAADLADPNGNGVTNLLEYALGGDPRGNGPVNLLKHGVDGSGKLTLSFAHDAQRTDVVLTVQGADSPAGPWTDLARSVAGQPFQAVQSGAGVTEDADGKVRVGDFPGNGANPAPRRFMRLQVTGP